MNSLVLILALLPGDSQADSPVVVEQPSMELLEYIGSLEQNEAGELLDPMDALPEEHTRMYSTTLPDDLPPPRVAPYHETP